MPAFGSITFEGVVGMVRPNGATETLDNPGQVDADQDIANAARLSTLSYEGWFAASQKAALYAMERTVVDVDDEAETGIQVRVREVSVHEVPALNGSTLGVFTYCSATVRPWA